MTIYKNSKSWVEALDKRKVNPNKGNITAYRLIAIKAIELLINELKDQGVDIRIGAELEFITEKGVAYSSEEDKILGGYLPQSERHNDDVYKINSATALGESPILSYI